MASPARQHANSHLSWSGLWKFTLDDVARNGYLGIPAQVQLQTGGG